MVQVAACKKAELYAILIVKRPLSTLFRWIWASFLLFILYDPARCWDNFWRPVQKSYLGTRNGPAKPKIAFLTF